MDLGWAVCNGSEAPGIMRSAVRLRLVERAYKSRRQALQIFAQMADSLTLSLSSASLLQLMNNLDFGAAVKEIGQAAQYLKDTGAPKVGITGK